MIGPRLTISLAAVASACGTPPIPRFEIALCDRSVPPGCTEADARAAVTEFLDAPAGSALELLATSGDATPTPIFRVDVPRTWGPGVRARKAAWRREEEQRLAAMVLPVPQPCSPIAESIAAVGARFRERRDASFNLLIISDGRQVSALANFERTAPDAAGFVAALRQEGLLPDLRGVTVTFCGVHGRSYPKAPAWSPKRTAAVRAAWLLALTEAGAGPIRMTESCRFGQTEAQQP